MSEMNIPCKSIAMGRIMFAVPVVLPFPTLLLKDVLTISAKNVITKTKDLMKHYCALWNPLVALFELFFLCSRHFCIFIDQNRVVWSSYLRSLWHRSRSQGKPLQ